MGIIQVCLYFSSYFLISATESNSYAAIKLNRIHFEVADSNQRNYLVDFAIASNDIYRTRTASLKVAQKVFEISAEVFQKKLIYVLKSEDEIIGFVALKSECWDGTTDIGELGHLFIKTGLQKRGFGSLLFNKAIELAREQGFRKLVWISDPDAKDFYLKMGATIMHYDANLLNPTVDVPIFEYIL